MASLKDVEQLADDLDGLVTKLRSELRDGRDFEKLSALADRIAEHADGAAETFASVNDTLAKRIQEIGGAQSGGRSSSRSSGSRQKASA
jgi:hypothetical protein